MLGMVFPYVFVTVREIVARWTVVTLLTLKRSVSPARMLVVQPVSAED